MDKNKNTERAFGLRDKIGYMFGDFGNDFTFIFASSFLMVFYTKVLGINGGAVGTLFLVARFVDAFTDVTMGRIVDSVKEAKDGRFRCWLRRMAGPVALASFLMYQSAMAGAPMGIKMVYMYVTYLLWGSIFYTSINIPYGSMASAITSDPDERTALSTFRNIGATLASLVIGVATPLLIYTTDAEGNQIVRGGSTFTVIAGVFAICAVLCYFICYKMTTERVHIEHDKDKKQITLIETFAAIFKSRALLGIIGAAIFLMLSQLLISSMNNFLYPEYFKNAAGISSFTMLSTGGVLLIISPLSVKISSRFGKKESAATGVLASGIIFLALYFLRIKNMWIFLLITCIGYLGLGYFNTVIWANITDVIDDQEVKTGVREDGTVYAVYSFARKVGQALAGGIGGWALDFIGYESAAKVQTEAVINGIYTTSTLVPAIGFLIVAFFLWVVYPLNKSKVELNVQELKKRRNS
ncbi:MFS transporter [Clostridium sp. chh4-2]|uniref:MFS transporter n=1 Tax=Clostridium sp. chh4-2 TaxID=2067550 RepID=UPI000CCE188E|nr:glycoside-pentoside-hexuronide (GPH):cation symporter [Clostridium sp. chh4-2]PNV61118.1 MFS transporter [Clostridium sp. chh4-2]